MKLPDLPHSLPTWLVFTFIVVGGILLLTACTNTTWVGI